MSRPVGYRVTSLCGLLLWALLLGACRDPDKVSGTALFVTLEFPPSLRMDQLIIAGTVDDMGIGPHVLPEPPRLISNGETFRILLPEAPDEALAELTIEGHFEREPVALGEASTQVRAEYEVDLTVRLEPLPPPDTGVCLDCADGCCQDGVCTPPTLQACGARGIACVECNPNTTDTCSPDGLCACGVGPACDLRLADRCSNGQCRCGGGAMCAPGQECVSGRCVCSPSSCNGCCAGNTCQPGNTYNQCGAGGAECRKCGGSSRCLAGGTCGR